MKKLLHKISVAVNGCLKTFRLYRDRIEQRTTFLINALRFLAWNLE
jgi:hypothetical protein